MNKIAILALTLSLFIASCGVRSYEPTIIYVDSDTNSEDRDTPDIDRGDIGNTGDTGDTANTGDTAGESCHLDSQFLAPKYENYVTLHQIGRIFNYDVAYRIDPTATYSKSVVKADAFKMEGDWGAYMDYREQFLFIQANGHTFTTFNNDRTEARVHFAKTTLQFNHTVISTMVNEQIRTDDFRGEIAVQEMYFDVRLDSSEKVTEENIRKMCVVGVSAKGDSGESGEIYACLERYQAAHIGETLKMMFNLKISVEEDDILAFINTRYNGTIATVEDDDYKPHICQCFSLYEKNDSGFPVEIDCSEFNPEESLFPDPPVLFTQIPNGNFDDWSGDPEMAERWMMGKNAPFATEIAKVTHDDYWATHIYHDAKTTTQTVFQTEPFTIFYMPPKSIALQIKTTSTPVGEPPGHHFPEVSFKLACSPAPFDETVAQNIQYNWNATEKIFIDDGNLDTNIVNTENSYLSTAILLGDNISSLWKGGSKCRLEVISGSSADAGANFDVIIDNFVVKQ